MKVGSYMAITMMVLTRTLTLSSLTTYIASICMQLRVHAPM